MRTLRKVIIPILRIPLVMAPKTSSNLADRFKKARGQEKEEDTLARLNAMSLQQLQELPICFGKAKIGTPFHEVVHNDPSYCQWFLGLYGDSKDPKHVEFVHYLRLYIERMELENGESGNEEEKPKGTQGYPSKDLLKGAKSQGPLTSDPINLKLGGDRDGRAGGACDHAPSHGSNGTCPESDCAAAAALDCTEPISSSSSEPTNTVSGTEAQRDILRSFVEMYNIHSEGNHHGFGDACIASSVMGNFISKEMWGYIKEERYKIHQPSQCCELLEIYCSADSQLTKQCLREGSYAIRFGLSQGDLSLYENRCKLYDLIIKHRPSNIWMSPKRKAWNKWSQFNASRSPEAAIKIMQAREDDLVHLLLCSAIFELQTQRGPSFYFHLEQPAGSDMLYEEPLQIILDHTMIARCNMCVPGD